jgi:23S rRNA (cytidine2498-2'-O)-methyltransferase
MLQGVVEKGGDLRVEVADTNESKELMKFCRKFTVPLRAALREAGVLTNYETPKRPVVHVFFIAPAAAIPATRTPPTTRRSIWASRV